VVALRLADDKLHVGCNAIRRPEIVMLTGWSSKVSIPKLPERDFIRL